jgi:hypothetical protein
MSDVIVDVDGKPKIKFVVQNHSLIMDTINTLIGEREACNFCGAAPIVIVYRGWDDRIVIACKAHEEIVLEMIERAA